MKNNEKIYHLLMGKNDPELTEEILEILRDEFWRGMIWGAFCLGVGALAMAFIIRF